MNSAIRYLASGIKFSQIYVLAMYLNDEDFSSASALIYALPIFVSVIGLELYTQTQRGITTDIENFDLHVNQQYFYTIILSFSGLTLGVGAAYCLAGWQISLAFLAGTICATEYFTQELVRIAVALNSKMRLSLVYLLRVGLWLGVFSVFGSAGHPLSLEAMLVLWAINNVFCGVILHAFISQIVILDPKRFDIHRTFSDFAKSTNFMINAIALRVVNNGDKLIASLYLDPNITKTFLLSTFFLQIGVFLLDIAFSQIFFKDSMHVMSKIKNPFGLLEITGARIYLLIVLIVHAVLMLILFVCSQYSHLINFEPYYIFTTIGAMLACIHLPLHYLFYSNHKDNIIRLSSIFSLIVSGVIFSVAATTDIQPEFIISSTFAVFYLCNIGSKIVLDRVVHNGR